MKKGLNILSVGLIFMNVVLLFIGAALKDPATMVLGTISILALWLGIRARR